MLHAFGHAYSPWSDMAASFRAEIVGRSPEPIDLYEVSLDTARVQDSKDEAPFVEYIHALLSTRSPDLIVPVGAPAAFFLQRNRSRLFPTAPTLILGADIRRIPGATRTEYDTGVLLDLDLPAYVTNILQLLPGTMDIAVVVGNSPVERYWTAELRRAFEQFRDRVNITWFNELTFGEMQERAASMSPNSVIFWFLLSEDATGVPYSEDRALDTMREKSAVPIFGMGDYQMGRGVVGGPLMQTKVLGQQGAVAALRILKGERPRAVDPPSILFGQPVYDSRELQRWDISEARLPPGSIVQFREPTVWEQYRWQIFAALGVLLFQTALITGLVFERQRRVRATEQAGAAWVETGRYRDSLAHLVRLHTVGEMSAAIAHEINQPLAAIKNYAYAARSRLRGDATATSAKAVELLDKIEEQASRAGDVMRSLRAMAKKHKFEATQIDVGKLVADAVALVEMESRNVDVRLETAIAPGLPPAHADAIQIQQVVLNLVRNAVEAVEEARINGSGVKVAVACAADNEIVVSVADSGPGIAAEDAAHIFDPFYSTKDAGLGVGLSISRAIVEAHGGKLSLAPSPAGGCIFRFTLPGNQEKLTA
jgi:signal transduction histidine kinase